jgi:serine/threonine protein kinase
MDIVERAQGADEYEIVHNDEHIPAGSLAGKSLVPSDMPMRQFLESRDEIIWTTDGDCPKYTNFGPFEFVNWLGHTGDAERITHVDRVICANSPKWVVARKLIPCDNDADWEGAKEEVKTLKGMRHPHIIAFVGQYTQLVHFAVLAYPAAEWSLNKFMVNMWTSRETDECSRAKAYHLRRYFVCISQALRYVHDSSVRHKDIKPTNILIDTNGNVLLADFGISRLYLNKDESSTNTEKRRSWDYCAPEFVDQQTYCDFQSDIFSLGAVFAEMATVILGKPLAVFRTYREEKSPDNDPAFHSSIEATALWLKHISVSQEADWPALKEIKDIIPNIMSTLSKDISTRPTAPKLRNIFCRVSPRQCEDCWDTEKWPISEELRAIAAARQTPPPPRLGDRLRPQLLEPAGDTTGQPYTSPEPLPVPPPTPRPPPSTATNGNTDIHVPSANRPTTRRGRHVLVYHVRTRELTIERMSNVTGTSRPFRPSQANFKR